MILLKEVKSCSVGFKCDDSDLFSKYNKNKFLHFSLIKYMKKSTVEMVTKKLTELYQESEALH